jgi:PIN domain nuclease of toxin-antitoxin system
MRILLDTHVFLWHLTDDPRLPAPFLAAILDPGNEVYLSVASVWEAVVKYQIGKLPLPGPPEVFLPAERQAHGISSLAIDEETMPHLAGLPLHHRDPFDRILVAQALQHGLTVATVDPAVAVYPVPLLPTT